MLTRLSSHFFGEDIALSTTLPLIQKPQTDELARSPNVLTAFSFTGISAVGQARLSQGTKSNRRNSSQLPEVESGEQSWSVVVLSLLLLPPRVTEKGAPLTPNAVCTFRDSNVSQVGTEPTCPQPDPSAVLSNITDILVKKNP